MSLQEILEAPVNLLRLIRRLQIDEDALEQAALEQPGLLLESSRYRAKKMRRRAMALIDAEVIRAQTGLGLRASKYDGSKALTEKAVTDKTLLSPKYRKAKRKLERLYVEEEWAKSLVTAYMHRLSVLKLLVEIRNTDMHSEIRQAKSKMAVDSMRKRAERIREGYEESGTDEDDAD